MKSNLLQFADRIFRLKENATSLSTEFIAGLTTFAAMSYILAVNPAILGAAGMDKAAVVTVTALAAALGCFFMALLANLPIALAPAMGTNTYFAIIICVSMGLSWQQALALTFYNGIFFFIISITGLREKLVYGVPRPLQVGLQCGIGLFIAFFGLQSAKIVVSDSATLVTAGALTSPEALFALAGLAIMSILICRKVSGAIIITILLMTILGLVIPDAAGKRISQMPSAIFSLPHGISETFMQLDWLFPYREFQKAMPLITILLLLDLFDTLATVVAMGRASGLMDENGRMKGLGNAFVADALATISGAMLGTSTTGAYVESAAGINAGGRTGLTAAVVGILFIMSLFLTPVINAIPPQATAPALIIVGIMMMQGFRDLKFGDMTEMIPAVFCMLMVALSFKITEGFAFGIISYVLIMIATKRSREIRAATWLMCCVMILFLAVV